MNREGLTATASLWAFLTTAALGAAPPPLVQHGPELPPEAISKLAGIAKEGTTPAHARRLREVLVGALADVYKRQATQARGAAWTAESIEEFWGWLQKQEDLYAELLLAIHPRDDAAGVFTVAENLRREFSQDVPRYPHLVIAYAVVWDSRPPIPHNRYLERASGPAKGPALRPATMVESFRFLLQSRANLSFRPEQLRWPFLVYVADNDCTLDDRRWAQRQFATQRADLGPVYSKVPYDYDRYDKGKPPSLGENPGTLANLLKYGGVCADQAYFASRVCKSFDVPAAAFGGANRFGGLHAWVGYLGVAKAGGRARPEFRFHGRYRGDHYYIGSVSDPQTGLPVTDRELALLFDGAAEYADYERARLLWRVARYIEPQDTQAATALLKAAVRYNIFFGPAWLDVAGKVADGAVPKADGVPLLRYMLAGLQKHPDLSLAVLDKFLTAVPEAEVETRNRFYENAYRLYGGRPDLQARLRQAQGGYLEEHDRADEALRVMGATALANAGEAIHILPLAVRTLEVYREKKSYDKGARFAEALLQKMPKEERRGHPSPAYVEFCKATADFCETGGLAARARKWRDELGRLQASSPR